jgi:uncharacterized protein (DUF924 family)
LSDVSPEDVHRFWFADAVDDPQAADERRDLWFRCSPAFDDEIRERFGSTIAEAARGELSAWEYTPRSCVSLVIVLDQFPRNAYRNTVAAFANDPLALALTRRAIAARYVDRLSIVERAFLLMPYQHVENVAAQRDGIVHFERMTTAAPPHWRPFAENTLQFARRHLEIVERFGRFPHRNAVLGRSSTPAEQAYLDTKPDTFGQQL